MAISDELFRTAQGNLSFSECILESACNGKKLTKTADLIYVGQKLGTSKVKHVWILFFNYLGRNRSKVERGLGTIYNLF